DSGGVVMEILQYAHELAERLERREISAEEVTQAYLDRMERLEPHVHAFLARTPEQALATAREVDRRPAQGEPVHPLAGIPVPVMINHCTGGVPTTAGTRALQRFRPRYSATAVARFHEVGLPLEGKFILDEFAMGASTGASVFGPARNPWDRERVPG